MGRGKHIFKCNKRSFTFSWAANHASVEMMEIKPEVGVVTNLAVNLLQT